MPVYMRARDLREREREREREEKFVSLPISAMANSGVVKLLASCIAVVLCFLLVSSPFRGAEATVTCSEVTSLLRPCVDYLLYGGEIPSSCCAGVKQVKAASTTGEDRRTACSCIQDAASMIPGLDYNLISSLPSECGVSLPYKISPSTDCSSIN